MTFTFRIFGYLFEIRLGRQMRVPVERLKT